jgi:peptide/nickel transport system ATP-binding protein
MMPVLQISGLDLSIGHRSASTPILRGIDLSIESGEIRGLVGESGAGKTMVGLAVADLLPESARVTAGRILFEGRNLIGMRASERRKFLGESISMVLQNPMTALNPVLRIEQQMIDVQISRMGLSRRQARLRALELLERVHIRAPERVLRQYPHELSGGMCQRIVIAIAFSCKPRLIIADEPTTALDVTVQLQVLRLLREMQRDSAASVLFVTHDLGVVAKLCDNVSVIFAGQILEAGSTEQIFANPRNEYTAALMAATPRYDQAGKGLRPVPQELTARLLREASAYDMARHNA